MNVFIPAKKEANPFFDEIMKYSKHTFIFESYKKYDDVYKIVLIHWPEQIFNWIEPSLEQLQELSNNITIWKRTAKIIYVVHNLERHYGMTENFNKLYQLIEDNCDCMVHMGSYSCNLFKTRYLNKQHQIINHPLYENSFKVYSKEVARKKLNIAKDAIIIIAPGTIRNDEESKLVLNSFKKIKNKKKILIVPRMLPFEFPFEFKGRTYLKRFVDVKKHYIAFKKWQYAKSNYIFNYSFLSRDNLALLMSASDIVFIPRIKILNSGNVFLAMTFNKIMLGPNQGNLTEIFNQFKLPYFDPNNKNSISKAMKLAVNLVENEHFKYNVDLLNEFKPLNIAKQWDNLIEELSS